MLLAGLLQFCLESETKYAMHTGATYLISFFKTLAEHRSYICKHLPSLHLMKCDYLR
jgi:hypothetical protein